MKIINNIVYFLLHNRIIAIIVLIGIIIGGLVNSPFDIGTEFLPRNPVSVDAIPNIGENQQIVFTKWNGVSPKDIDNQITYPLTTYLLGIPGVKTIRGNSMFGFSSIYIVFEEDIEFYWSRSRILERLSSLPSSLLPDGVRPILGPDATALGQIFWYTLEPINEKGNLSRGWDLHELRTIQDFQIKYALGSVKGVSEVVSIGGFVKEYHVNIKQEAMETHNIDIMKVVYAIKNSNLDIGVKTLEINKAEYFIRSIGYIKSIKDIEESVVETRDGIPIKVKDVATISYGPKDRRGILDKNGLEAVGGVVIAQHNANPMEVIVALKEKIQQLSYGLPVKELEDGSLSKITIVPFYDRSKIIYETLDSLKETLILEVIIIIIVVITMLRNIRVSLLVSLLLPLSILCSFILMKYFQVDANIISIAGIAISIGMIVDIGIVSSENVIKHMEKNSSKKSIVKIFYESSIEITPILFTTVLTTIISFIPILTMIGTEGVLFRPLVITKTFILLVALLIVVFIFPAVGSYVLGLTITSKAKNILVNLIVLVIGLCFLWYHFFVVGIMLIVLALIRTLELYIPSAKKYSSYSCLSIVLGISFYILVLEWMPLGLSNSLFQNCIFVFIIIGSILFFFYIFYKFYTTILDWCLRNKLLFISIPLSLVLSGFVIWIGWNDLTLFIDRGASAAGITIKDNRLWNYLSHAFPGIGEEFMPSLDEGSFLFMPSSMPHSGIEENRQLLGFLDKSLVDIPEVEGVLGKIGRIDSPIDPAPISMFEIIINYKSEYISDFKGAPIRFAIDEKGGFLRDDNNSLIEDPYGNYFRQWRDHIHTTNDIWNEIVNSTRLPNLTSSPKLQPIETRLIMVQTGMRAPIGIKILGDKIATIESFGLELEKILREVPSIRSESVFADRIIAKPYIEIHIDRVELSRYGLTINDLQHHIAVAIGGMPLDVTVEGRESYAIRVRYPREQRDDPEKLKSILIPTSIGVSIPLGSVVDIKYSLGPQSIKSENTFLVSYLIFDKKSGFSEIEVVNEANKHIKNKIAKGIIEVPPNVSYYFAGNYENQIRASKQLKLIIPIIILLIIIILYLQFRDITSILMLGTSILVAFSGGFIIIWLYGQDSFMNYSLGGINLRDIFQIKPIFISTAVWIGFISLFGIATDDGVIMLSYLKKSAKPTSYKDIHNSITQAGLKRLRPCLMTTITTIIALLPILSSSKRGSDIMIPICIPVLGGMIIEVITLLVIPVLYAMQQERKLKYSTDRKL